MEVKGIITQILDVQTGQGKNGEWKKGGFILEQEGKYPKNVSIDLWNDELDKFTNKVQDYVTVSVNIESREHNGRWFTNVSAWKIDSDNGITNKDDGFPPNEEPAQVDDEVPDLPF